MICASECFVQGGLRKIFHFLACPEFLKFFNVRQETVDNLLANDFCCGYMAAVLTFLLIFILLLIVRLLIFLLFRTRRCSRITIPSADGELIVNRSAVEAVVRKELHGFPQIFLRKLLLFKRGKNYSLKIFCSFERSGSGLPEIVQELKPRLKEVMKELFGIGTMTDISICIEKLRQEEEDEAEAETAAPVFHQNGPAGF